MTSSSVIRQLLPGGREPVHSYQQVTFKQQRMKTTTNMASEFGLMAAQALRVVMPGKVALPGEDSYLQARQIYNGAVEYQPALFALCETVADVQAAVRVAREHNLGLSVRGGGHDWAGRSLRDRGLVIDLSKMRRVEVDVKAQVATAEGGATAGDLVAAAAPHNLVGVTGTASGVGMAGLTLGGGYGPLTPQFGLALDNLLGAEIVLGDGRKVNADAFENAELYWALRGGGGNFGVVTSMRIRLHPLRELLAGIILFPWSEAKSVLHGYADIAASAGDEFAVITNILSGPDGDPVVLLAPIWTGDQAPGKQAIAELQRLGSPILAKIGPMTYSDLLRTFDANFVNGRHYELQTRWLPKLTPEPIRALLDAGSGKTSTFSNIILQHFHGTPTRVPIEATAFGLRREHFLITIVAAWEPTTKDNGNIHRQWARDLSQVLASAALPGGYPNVLGPHERDQAALAFGTNTPRLQTAKGQFDPDGIFTSAIPLPE
jgi:FAD/FMN-containing dehydrogenase